MAAPAPRPTSGYGEAIGSQSTRDDVVGTTDDDPLALLDAIWSTSDDALFTLNEAGLVTGWNRSAERIFGYLEDEIVGEPWQVLFPGHVRVEIEALFATLSAGARILRFETDIERKDGMPMTISLSSSPTSSAFVVIARDITERELAQATLAEIEARVRESEALAHVGGWLWDVRTDVVQWSDELHRIHGIDPLEFEGTLAAHLAAVHEDDRAQVGAAMGIAVTGSHSFDLEYRVVRTDGEIRWLHARAHPTMGLSGTAIGLRGIGQDVTDRHT
jgi:PAS domain S-box-containing protein